MPIDLAVLATTVVTNILLPYVQKGAEKIAEQVTNKLSKAAGDHAVDVAGKVWQRIQSVFTSEEDKAALSQFQKRPAASEPLVKTILQEKLQVDAQLAEELNRLVAEPAADGSGTTVQIMHNSGIVGYADARGAHISGGVLAGAYVAGSPPRPTSQPTKGPDQDGS